MTNYLMFLSREFGITFSTLIVNGVELRTWHKEGQQGYTSLLIHHLLEDLKAVGALNKYDIRTFSLAFPEVDYLGKLGECELKGFLRFVKIDGGYPHQIYAEVVEDDGFLVTKTLDGFVVVKQVPFWSEWDDHLAKNNLKISCIKAYRNRFNTSLLEANNAVEARMARLQGERAYLQTSAAHSI